MALVAVALVAVALSTLSTASTATATTAGAAPKNLTEFTAPATATTPPTGWASWNSFAAAIDFTVIKKQVDAFVAAGLPKAGYRYVNIDEGWWQGTRDAAGNITTDPADWPGGMQAIAGYIHSKGLKAGIYTDAGADGCGFYFPTGRPAAPGSGSAGHYDQDMLQFSRWGFDYVKVDWCGGIFGGLDPKTTYATIGAAAAKASAATGRPLTLSICEWGIGNPWEWGPGTGTLWRTSGDIIHYGQSALPSMYLNNFDYGQHPLSQHTGYLNDPDMMIVGMPGLTAEQNQTHMSLWAVSGAPMLLGNDLSTMSARTTAIVTNRKVIAIDQDSRGLQGVKVAEDTPGLQVYSKVLAGSGQRAVVLLNRTAADAPITVRNADLGLTGRKAEARNLWTTDQQATTYASQYTVRVPAGEAVLLSIDGTDLPDTDYRAPARATTGADTFTGVRAQRTGVALATITYSNPDQVARTATVQVSGSPDTVVSMPPTSSPNRTGHVSLLISLALGSANTVTLISGPAARLTIEALTVQPLGPKA